jgi:hypothetical protein
MARYVLGLKDLDRIHVGDVEDFIQHVGRGSGPGEFDPQRVIDLADDWELYDEEGFALGAQRIDDNGVELVRYEPARQVNGAELVARVNFILGIAQSQVDDLRLAALEETRGYVGTVANLAPDAAVAPDAAAFAAASQELAESAERLRLLVTDPPFPVVHADLPVVLAALAEAFNADPQAPNRGTKTHDRLHERGLTHA